MPLEFAQVPLSALTVGTVLTEPIFEIGFDRRKLLGKSIAIDLHSIKQLEARGISSVSVSKRDLAAMSAGTPQGKMKIAPDHEYQRVVLVTEHTREVENDMEAIAPVKIDPVPLPEKWSDPPCVRYEAAAVKETIHQREKQVSYVDGLYDDLVTRGGSDSGDLATICRDSLNSIMEDKDLFLSLGLNPYESEYPSRHSLHVCTVAISIGVMLGLDDKSLMDLGTGCLIHDVGMLKLDPNLYRSKRRLTASELAKLATHPILTLEALACPGVKLSRVARLVAYQIHERCDGSGYPRGITSDDIHSLSKIAAVADAYVGLVSNRKHRKALMPYFALEKILKTLPEYQFEPKVVRGLLHGISLFPIGSFVELRDGRVCRVVRATGETYTQPILEIWNTRFRRFEPDLLNLKQETTATVRRAIPGPLAA